LVVQDATDGIWVDMTRARQLGLWEQTSDPGFRRLKVGDRVRLRGVSERGGFAPVLIPRGLEVLASGVDLPEAPVVTVPAVLSGKHDVQRVTMQGVVQETSVGGQSTPEVLILKLVNTDGQILLRVPRTALPPEADLLDTQISVSGTVISRHNSRAEMSGAILVTDQARDIKVLRPGLPPWQAPVLSLASLRPFESGGLSSSRRRIAGTVTSWQPGHRLILQEGSAAVEVTTRHTQPLALGTVVEASGFVSSPGPICRLENAELRALRSGAPPPPVEITLPELLDASRRRHVKDWQRSVFDYHFRLVRLTGTLVEAFGGPDQEGRTLLLRSGGLLLPVEWEGAPAAFGADWRPGSELAVTGIVRMEPSADAVDPDDLTGDGDVSLHLRDAADVQVLSAASWWTRQRLVKAAWAGLGLSAAVLLVIGYLSRRVRRQAAELAGRIALQHEAEIRFQATLAERNRLGADMHDGLQQFLAGLSMQLEAAHGSLEMGRDAAPALVAARKLLLNLREDFRHCVNALQETQAEMDIPDILERTAAIIRTCHPVEVEVQVVGPPAKLPGKAVANLMLIVQEAASNAVRHGKALRIVLRCQFKADAVTMDVQDDGTGFDPAKGPTDPNHFGLHNMRERIGQLGGSLQIESRPGQGSRITAGLPLPLPLHETS
jgi:signal transduction histidine kinase